MSQNGARDRTAAPSEPVRPHLRAARAVGRWQVRTAADLPLLRHAVRAAELRTGAGAEETRLDHSRLALVATELATNALKYASGPCVVTIFRMAGGWLLEVVDSRPDSPPVRHPPEPGRPGGNGLLIIEQLSSRWGWYPAEDGGGKHVWVELPD